MSNYILELSVIHLSLIAGYWFFLRNESQYGKLRAYLVGSTILALGIPFLKLPKLIGGLLETNTAEPTLESIPVEPMAFTPTPESFTFDFSWLWYAYALVSAYFLYRFVSSIAYLIQLNSKSNRLHVDQLDVRKSDHIKGSFTFFHWIFISQDVQVDQEEYAAILKHETAHARLGHTYDLIFFQLFRACFWWLPSAWYINKEIKKIHEYQADAYALKSYNLDRYSSILISSTLKSNGLSLASSFHDGLILKRLKAMKQNAKQVSPWKFGALLSLLAVLFVVFACSEEIDQDIKKMGEVNNSITFDQLPIEMQEKLADVKDKLIFTKLEIEDNEIADVKGSLKNAEELQNLDPSTIHSVNVDKEASAVFIAIKKDGANFDYIAEKSKMDGEVFTIVEEQPEYPGGMKAFYQYVGENLNYPEQARRLGIEGRVYVQFIVEKDGSVSDVKPVKGIGGGCDSEAARVIAGLQNFEPGTQRGRAVRVRMVLPIIFKLDSSNPEDVKNVIIVEEVEQSSNQLKVGASYDQGIWTGTVYDPETGNPLPGVNVIEEGTNHGTVSDLKGNFKIKLTDTSNNLVFSFIGFESKKLSAAKN